MLTPDPSTEAPHFTDKNGEDTCNRVAAFWEDRAKREHAWVHRLEDEIAALAARLSQAEEREAQYVAALKAARPFLGLEIRPRPGESIMPSAGAIVADALALAASSAGETGDG